jgi:protein tyrosine/serine phosphatase
VVIGASVPIVRNQSFFRRFPKRLAAVEEGVLYRSAQPTGRQIGNLAKELGIRTVVIVREGSSGRVREELESAGRHGLNAVTIPVQSQGPIPDDQVSAFFQCVDDPENQPVLVHCAAGRHRTGYLCALYRIERQGWTVQKAVEEMLAFGFDQVRHGVLLESLERYEPGRRQAGLADPEVQTAQGTETPP